MLEKSRESKPGGFLCVLLCAALFFIISAEAGETSALDENSPKKAGVPSSPSELALSLKDCLDSALKDNPLLSEAQMGIQAAQMGVESATGRHFPKLSLDGNYTKRQDPWPYIPAQSATILPHFSDEFSYWQVVMTIPIYQGGQIMNGPAGISIG